MIYILQVKTEAACNYHGRTEGPDHHCICVPGWAGAHCETAGKCRKLHAVFLPRYKIELL